jgi:putative FmdB family regulatory protein
VEAQQSFTEEPLKECPHCGGRLRRVFHPVGIVLKGSGFYSTDNRSSRKGAGSETTPGKEGGETGQSKEPAATSEAKSDAKPAKDGASSKDSTSKSASSKKAKK